jgi:hypothetical protein
MNAHSNTTDFATAVPAASLSRSRRTPAWRYSTGNEALAASIDALKSLHDEFEQRFDAHTAADEARGAALQRFGTPRPDYNGMACANVEPDPAPPEYAAVVKACDRSDRAQVRARGRVDVATKALLKVRVATIEDALLKGQAYAWSHGCADTSKLPFEEDIGLVLAALRRDIAGLQPNPTSSGSPTFPPFDPAAWVDAFEAIPGHQIHGNGPCYMEPEAFPEGSIQNSPFGQALWYALTDDQKAAVRAIGRERRPPVPPGTDFSKWVYTPVDRPGEPVDLSGCIVGREAIKAAWISGREQNAADAEDPEMWPAMVKALEEVCPEGGALARAGQEAGMTATEFGEALVRRYRSEKPQSAELLHAAE